MYVGEDSCGNFFEGETKLDVLSSLFDISIVQDGGMWCAEIGDLVFKKTYEVNGYSNAQVRELVLLECSKIFKCKIYKLCEEE